MRWEIGTFRDLLCSLPITGEQIAPSLAVESTVILRQDLSLESRCGSAGSSVSESLIGFRSRDKAFTEGSAEDGATSEYTW